MSAQFYFPLTPIHHTLIHLMGRELGQLSQVNNYEPIIRQAFEGALYPYIDFPYEILRKEVLDYGISQGLCEQVMGYLIYTLGGQVKQVMGGLIGTCWFDVKIDLQQQAVVAFITHRLEDFTPTSPLDFQTMVYEPLLDAIERSDYIPPKLRRLAGIE